ncbi:OmpA family protein [Corallincola platygyrae]|uniref:OmpA family protein n=1 Tax=Corallincola platygyrae TaxID=1193278 RepID=A0ABW4XLD7_9GAMM
MKIIKWFVLLSVVWISGCTSTGQVSTKGWCAIVGGAGGGLLGAIDSAGAAGAGAAAGALIGYFVCDNDEDGDGVPDGEDQCPNTPEGVKVDAVGCPIDSDGDGVPDYLDKCPGTPANAPVDSNGCPLDSDGDGVPDYKDQCPDTPPNTVVDEVGCPPPKAGPPAYMAACGDMIMMEDNRIVGFKHILFDFDSDQLTPQGQEILNCVAAVYEETSIPMDLDGYTCFVGDEAYNERLSQRRAHSARNYLVSKGVKENVLRIEWHGESSPVADNNDLGARYLNRRVEVSPE